MDWKQLLDDPLVIHEHGPGVVLHRFKTAPFHCPICGERPITVFNYAAPGEDPFIFPKGDGGFTVKVSCCGIGIEFNSANISWTNITAVIKQCLSNFVQEAVYKACFTRWDVCGNPCPPNRICPTCSEYWDKRVKQGVTNGLDQRNAHGGHSDNMQQETKVKE